MAVGRIDLGVFLSVECVLDEFNTRYQEESLNWQDLLRCPVCKGVLTDSKQGWVCSHCEVVFPVLGGVIDLIPEQVNQRIARSVKAWSAIGWDYNAKIGEMSAARIRAVDQPLLKLCKPGMRVLEIGCGTARLRHQVEAQGAEYYGLDPSMELLGEAKGGNLIRAVGEYLPFADQSFDLILGGFCSFRYIEVDLLLPECRRVLKKGGWMAYTLWNGWALYWSQWMDWVKSLSRGQKPYQPKLWQHGSHDVINPWSEIRVLRRHGFRVVSLLSTKKFPLIGKFFPWESYWHGLFGALFGYDLIFTSQKEGSYGSFLKKEGKN